MSHWHRPIKNQSFAFELFLLRPQPISAFSPHLRCTHKHLPKSTSMKTPNRPKRSKRLHPFPSNRKRRTLPLSENRVIWHHRNSSRLFLRYIEEWLLSATSHLMKLSQSAIPSMMPKGLIATTFLLHRILRFMTKLFPNATGLFSQSFIAKKKVMSSFNLPPETLPLKTRISQSKRCFREWPTFPCKSASNAKSYLIKSWIPRWNCEVSEVLFSLLQNKYFIFFFIFSSSVSLYLEKSTKQKGRLCFFFVFEN